MNYIDNNDVSDNIVDYSPANIRIKRFSAKDNTSTMGRCTDCNLTEFEPYCAFFLIFPLDR